MNINKLIKQMSLEQKLAQMTQFNTNCLLIDSKGGITGPAKDLNLSKDVVASTGSTLNFYSAEEVIKLQKMHLNDDPNKIPLLFMHDVIHGFRTIYPIPLAMGATWNPSLLEKCCKMAAKEASVGGVHVTFNPMVDLVRDARWGRVMESTGEDTYLNQIMAKAQVRGFQGDLSSKYDIAACVKHYAAYGGAESGRDYNLVELSEHTLKEYYLPSYKAAIDEGVEMVMTSFNTLNGIPAAGNSWLVKDILRKEWKFNKVIISDYAAFDEMIMHGYCKDKKEAALKAINTTTDIEMMSTCYLNSIKDLINEGLVDEKVIDKCVKRILLLKKKLGLFKNPFKAASSEEEKKYFLCKEHRAICKEAAIESAVLLKNDGILPLNDNIESVAIIGPLAKEGMIGFWSCHGKEDEATSVYDGIVNLVNNTKVNYAKGCDVNLDAIIDDKLVNEAIEVAKNSKVAIICVGETASMSGEGNSRANITLSNAQINLIKEVKKVNNNVVVILFNGRPLVLTDILDDANAIFTMWQPGTEGGSAAADLIFNKANFSGKLTMTFPRHVGQCPIYYNHLNTGRPNLNDDITATYRSRYLDMKNSPLYPFGYGLSYTSFEISKPVLNKNVMTKDEEIKVKVNVKNIGKYKGKTVIQLYIRDLVSSICRPVKELKGFKKIELDVNEEKEVEFVITEDTLKYYGINNKYIAEKGEFELFISDCSDVNESVKFELK